MRSLAAASVISLLISLLVLAATLYAAYWIVRRAVRDGILDARDGTPPQPGGRPGPTV